MNLLLVDDHPLFRQGVALLLRDLDPGLSIEYAGSVAEALQVAQRRPDLNLILLDVALPGESGLDGLSQLRQRHEEIPVVVLSSADDRDTVAAAIARGAMGFIPKSSTPEAMLAALRVVLGGGIYLPPGGMLAGARPAAAESRAGVASSGRPSGPATTPRDLGLTPRQSDVLQQILQGKSVKLIARSLGMTENTAKTHVSAVLRALRVTTRTQAIVAASEMGLRFPR